jgi:hypothetical protein
LELAHYKANLQSSVVVVVVAAAAIHVLVLTEEL